MISTITTLSTTTESPLEACNGRISLRQEISLVAEQIADVVYVVLDHGGSLQRQSPSNHPKILGQTCIYL